MTEELNCSEGARMLIERMQSHPKEFKRDGRFSRIVDQILGNVPAGFCELSDRDDDALTAAFEKYIMEPNLTEYVVDEIFNGEKRRQEEQEQQHREIQARYANSLAASMASSKNQLAAGLFTGFNDPRVTLQSGSLGQTVWKYDEEEKKLQRSIMDKIRRKLKGESK